MPLIDHAYHFNRLRRLSLRRGLAGSKFWLPIGVGLNIAHYMTKRSATRAEVLYRHELVPGERFEVVARPAEPTRRQRRKAKRKQRKSEAKAQRKLAKRERRDAAKAAKSTARASDPR